MNKIQIIVNNGAGTGSAVPVWKETKEYLQEKEIPYNAYPVSYTHLTLPTKLEV